MCVPTSTYRTYLDNTVSKKYNLTQQMKIKHQICDLIELIDRIKLMNYVLLSLSSIRELE